MRPPRSRRQQPEFAEIMAAGLVDIFGDYACSRNRGRALLDQDRRGSSRIKRDEFLTPFPSPLLHQPDRQAVFFKNQPHEAGMRTDRMMQ